MAKYRDEDDELVEVFEDEPDFQSAQHDEGVQDAGVRDDSA